MKILLYIALLAVNFLIVQYSLCCPNCVAKVTEQTPPFFADDFYREDDENQIEIEDEEL